MRIPKYLSPTAIKKYVEDKEDYFLQYLSEIRIPRFPQTLPMAAGSSFDAYVKSYLHNSLFGEGYDLRFQLGTIFEEQVESQNRDWGWRHGKRIFDEYKEAGCLADLMLELSHAVGDPRFEFTVMGKINGIPLLGKPDIFFINNQGARVIYDWKVNGYCSDRLKSPMKGFVKLRSKVQGIYYPKIHKDCHLHVFKGVAINLAMFLEDGNKDWADQLAIYAWLLGEEIGSEEIIFGIDQVCGPADRLRFATHRLRINSEYQYNLFELIKQIWAEIESGYIFRDLTEKQSKARCELLEKGVSDEVSGLSGEKKDAFLRMIQ